MSSKKTYTVRPSLLALTALVAVTANVFMDGSATAQVSLSIPTLTGMTAIDDGDAGFSGTFQSLPYPTAFKKDMAYTKGEKTASTAVWKFAGKKPGTYNVYATWAALPNNGPAVTYTIATTKEEKKTRDPVSVVVDQRNTPSDGLYDGVTWKKLTTVQLDGDGIVVTVPPTGSFTIVDGMAIQMVTEATPQKKDDQNKPLPLPVSPSTSQSSVAANTITLSSILVTGPTVTVNYTKNFSTCVHMLTPANQIAHSMNMFCANSGPVSVPLTQFNSLFGVGRSFKLCHGNNYGVCSSVVIAQSGIVQSSTSASSASSRISDNPCAMNPAFCRSSSSSIVITQSSRSSAMTSASNPCLKEKERQLPCSSSSLSVASSSTSSFIFEYFCNGRPQPMPCSSSSSITSSVSSAARAGSLTMTDENVGFSDTVVSNQKNVTLTRFTLTAGADSDVFLSSLKFTGFNGWKLANAQNYTLWFDTDGDLVTDSIQQQHISADQFNVVTFKNVFTVPRNKTVVVEVTADIASSPIDSNLGIVPLPDPITAETQDGSPLSGVSFNNSCSVALCQIAIHTTTPNQYTIAKQGDLFVSRDLQPRSRQLLGGALGDEILRLQFRANNEDIDVTTLRFNSSGSLSTSIDRLELYKLGDVTPFAVATSGACGALGGSFCAQMQGQQLVVPEGQVKIVTVRPRLKSDVNGAVSNEFIRIMIHPQVPSAITARGVFSSSDLISNDNDGVPEGEVFIGTDIAELNKVMVGSSNYTVLSKIVSIENANPDADGTNIPTGIAPAGQFRFTTAANTNSANGLNRVTITDVIFRVTAPNVQFNANGFKVFNRADATAKTSCSVLDYVPGSSSFLVACWDIASGGVDTRINSGNSLSLALQVDVTNPKVSNFQQSALQVSIDSFSNPALQGMASNLSHIRWVDSDVSASQQFWWVEHGDTVVKSTSYQS